MLKGLKEKTVYQFRSMVSFCALILCTCFLTLPLWGQHFNEEETRPNVLFILTDDLGYGDIRALNSQAGVSTPNMDVLVKEGIHFTDAHSASAVCTPTRYGILTGRYAWRSSLKSGVLWGYSAPLIEPDRPTIASFLQREGYHTAVIGKWHLGLGWQPVDRGKAIVPYDHQLLYDKSRGSNVDFTKPVTGGPLSLGFDYSYIFPASLDMTPYLYLENDQPTEPASGYTSGRNEGEHGRGVFYRAGEISPSLKVDSVLSDLAEAAIHYLEKRQNRDQPFFLYLSLTAPHTPWLPPDEFSPKSASGRYGDFVQYTDYNIGKVLDALHRYGLKDNTLVVLTSDNGAHWTPEDKKKFEHRPNYIFKGQKADIYEGGHRVPLILRWPERITPGSISGQLISSTDWFATFAGILGKAVPQQAAEDSYNMVEAIINPSEKEIRPTMIQHSLNGHFAIRMGQWKYTPQLGSGGFSTPASREPDPGESAATLYNLTQDPGEQYNLYWQQKERAQEMHQKLQEITGQEF